mmetsp:Transcript_625/g.787  ORF Transcript_625/g.787 Transcript_625/m.787 type:complete len:151 (-) Transcript_625:255-707(-)
MAQFFRILIILVQLRFWVISSLEALTIPSGVGEDFVIFPGNTECAEFEKTVTNSGHLWLLLFKKAYCPWCKEFDFEWQAASYDMRSSPRVSDMRNNRCLHSTNDSIYQISQSTNDPSSFLPTFFSSFLLSFPPFPLNPFLPFFLPSFLSL